MIAVKFKPSVHGTGLHFQRVYGKIQGFFDVAFGLHEIAGGDYGKGGRQEQQKACGDHCWPGWTPISQWPVPYDPDDEEQAKGDQVSIMEARKGDDAQVGQGAQQGK